MCIMGGYVSCRERSLVGVDGILQERLQCYKDVVQWVEPGMAMSIVLLVLCVLMRFEFYFVMGNYKM